MALVAELNVAVCATLMYREFQIIDMEEFCVKIVVVTTLYFYHELAHSAFSHR